MGIILQEVPGVGGYGRTQSFCGIRLSAPVATRVAVASVTSLGRICLWPQQFNQQLPGVALPRTIRPSIGPVPSSIARRRWVLACHRIT